MLPLLFPAPRAEAATVVRLAWDANTEPDLAGYRIHYGLSPVNHTLQTVDVGNVTSYTVSNNLIAGTTYYFVVTAYDTSNNESRPSNEVSAQPAVTIGPRLTISMTDAPDPVAAGNTLTYTLNYSNTGDTDATGVVITDAVPANTTFSSAPGGGTVSAGVVSWNLGVVSAGASGSVQMIVRVGSPLVNGTTITNGTYSITCKEIAAVPGTPITTTVTSSPVLSISMTDAPDPVTAGGLLTYTIHYSLSGNANASGVVLTDGVPPNTTFASATSNGTLSNGVVTWNLGSLSLGAPGSVQMVVRVASPLAVGTVITNGSYQIDSNETGPTTGTPITTTVAAAAPPIVSSAFEEGTGSIYIMQSASQTIHISGSNFQAGVTVSLGADITVGATSLISGTEMTAPITVSASAILGPRTVVVTNPDGGSASKVGALVVAKTADMNRDCKIDIADLNILARAWMTTSSDTAFNAAADLDGNGKIDGNDLSILTRYLGQRLAVCP